MYESDRRFTTRRAVEVMLPAEAARAWGPRAVDHQPGDKETTIPVWRARDLGSPFGSCRVTWNKPTPATALLTEVAWNDNHGGSYANVVTAVNSLAGWPILR